MFSMEKDKDTKSIYFGIGYGKFRSVEWFEENGAPLLQIVISTKDEARMEKSKKGKISPLRCATVEMAICYFRHSVPPHVFVA